MEDLNADVLRAFGVNPGRIYKEKNCYLFNTGDGMRSISKDSGSPEQIEFRNEVTRMLYEEGFVNIDRYFTAEDGRPFFELGGDLYCMSAVFRPMGAAFSDQTFFFGLVREIARMHSILGKTGLKNPSARTSVYSAEYITVLEQLQQLKRTLSSKKRLSDFDVLLLKNYGRFLTRIKGWREGMDAADYNRLDSEAQADGSVCHNLLKEENTALADGGVYIANFSECSVRPQCNDLAELIKRHFSSQGEKADINAIVEAYREVKDLCKDEIKALRAIIGYPDKFVGIISQYYNKKRSWVPGAYVSRLSSCINMVDSLPEYAENLR